MEVRKRDSSHLMSEREWEEFWHVLDSNRQRVGRPHALKAPLGPLARAKEEEESATGGADGPSAEPSPLRPVKNARCGTCEACLAKDCGRCKNCLDKPRFGGPGIKKKACVNRVCLNAEAPVSPTLAPNGGEGDACPPLEQQGSSRPPLVPLDAPPAAQAFNFQAHSGVQLLGAALLRQPSGTALEVGLQDATQFNMYR